MFYVYAWYNKNTKEVFYVGKGCGNRYKQIRGRNKLFIDYYNKNECGVKIVKYFENEQDAFDYEYKHITRLKLKGQCFCNLDDGGKGGVNFVWTDEMRKYKSTHNPMKDIKQRKRMSENNPMKLKEVSSKVVDKKKRSVVIDNKVFESVTDAAIYYGRSQQQIITWCKRGYDYNKKPCRYFDEEQKKYKIKVTNSKPVIIDGIKYESVKKAAEHFNTHSETIIRAIKQNRKFKGHSCKYGNQ